MSFTTTIDISLASFCDPEKLSLWCFIKFVIYITFTMNINSNLHSKFLLYGLWYSDFSTLISNQNHLGTFQNKETNTRLHPKPNETVSGDGAWTPVFSKVVPVSLRCSQLLLDPSFKNNYYGWATVVNSARSQGWDRRNRLVWSEIRDKVSVIWTDSSLKYKEVR